MRTGLLPPTAGDDQSSNEAACRRIMSCLFAEKAEAVGMLLLHSAERDGSLARAGMPDAEFERFITAAYCRAGVMGEPDAVEEKARGRLNYLRNRPLAWGLAAAALIVLIVLARGLFEIFAPKETDSLASRPSSTYQTASESTRQQTFLQRARQHGNRPRTGRSSLPLHMESRLPCRVLP